MTADLLRSPLKDHFRLIHLDTSLRNSIEDRGVVTLRSLWLTALSAAKLVFNVIVHRPRIVYCLLAQNATGFIRDSLFILLAKITGRKVVVRFGGARFDHFYANAHVLLQRYIRFVLARIDRVVVRSERFKPQFMDLVADTAFGIVPVALVPDEFVSAKPQSSNGQLRVLYLGMISPAKGAPDFLKAAAEVAIEFPQAKFLMAGSILQKERNLKGLGGSEDIQGEIDDLVHKGNLRGAVEFLGLVTGKDKVELYASADLFVCPSYSEGGGPLTVLEAMAAGLPVIATPVGLLPDVCQDQQQLLFVPIGEPAELAQKITYLLDRPDERKRLGKAGRELVCRCFNLEVYADRLEKVFRELL